MFAAVRFRVLHAIKTSVYLYNPLAVFVSHQMWRSIELHFLYEKSLNSARPVACLNMIQKAVVGLKCQQGGKKPRTNVPVLYVRGFQLRPLPLLRVHVAYQYDLSFILFFFHSLYVLSQQEIGSSLKMFFLSHSQGWVIFVEPIIGFMGNFLIFVILLKFNGLMLSY